MNTQQYECSSWYWLTPWNDCTDLPFGVNYDHITNLFDFGQGYIEEEKEDSFIRGAYMQSWLAWLPWLLVVWLMFRGKK